MTFDARSPAGRQVAPEGSLAGTRLLLVEDDDDARSALATFLRGAGAEVLEAGSAELALLAAGAFAPHLVVSDRGLPGLDGYELLRRLRAMGVAAPALLVTGDAHDAGGRRACAAGFSARLQKPVDLEELLAWAGPRASAGSPAPGTRPEEPGGPGPVV
jgi:DNA-binding response OmpR family regulator